MSRTRSRSQSSARSSYTLQSRKRRLGNSRVAPAVAFNVPLAPGSAHGSHQEAHSDRFQHGNH